MKCTKCGHPVEPDNVVIGGRRKFKRMTVRGSKLTAGEIETLTAEVMRTTQTGVPVFKSYVEPPPSIIMGVVSVIFIFALVAITIGPMLL